jgi:hypothetical protein
MTKKEFFEENYLNLLNQAKNELSSLITRVIKSYQEDDNHILFYEFGITQPIYREDVHGQDDMHETISSAWIDADGNVGFEVDTFDSGYDINMDDLDMDMVIYLIGEFEEVNLEV